jgi:hypothetical protein
LPGQHQPDNKGAWASIADLFQPEAEFAGPVDLEAFTAISDPDDRKFAALSAAVNVPLITNDGRVLAERGAVGIEAQIGGGVRNSDLAVHLLVRKLLMLSHPDRHSGRKRLGITQQVGANQKRVQASAFCTGVNFGGRPIFCPHFCAR